VSASKRGEPKIRFFRSAASLRGWLELNHAKAVELWIGFHKTSSPKTGVTYSEALDEALSFGWIDGVRKTVDETRYTSRFSPRVSRSYWSSVNIRRVRRLKKLGRMRPAGLEAFKSSHESRAARYSYENRPRSLPAAEAKRFKGSPKAWAFFSGQPPWYRRMAIWWVVSAVREETRAKRLAILIEDSSKGRRIGLLARPR
jgi:uncharacterized protein YdeI (YjbR/CyaY-like superfamily)